MQRRYDWEVLQNVLDQTNLISAKEWWRLGVVQLRIITISLVPRFFSSMFPWPRQATQDWEVFENIVLNQMNIISQRMRKTWRRTVENYCLVILVSRFLSTLAVVTACTITVANTGMGNVWKYCTKADKPYQPGNEDLETYNRVTIKTAGASFSFHPRCWLRVMTVDTGEPTSEIWVHFPWLEPHREGVGREMFRSCVVKPVVMGRGGRGKETIKTRASILKTSRRLIHWLLRGYCGSSCSFQGRFHDAGDSLTLTVWIMSWNTWNQTVPAENRRKL